jgi:hypothetical protein
MCRSGIAIQNMMRKHIAISFLAFCSFWPSVQAQSIDEMLTRDPYRKVNGVLYDLTDRFHWDGLHQTNYEATPLPEWKEFPGNVIQILPDGILLSKDYVPDNREVVFIKNFPKSIPLVDDERLAMYAMPSDRYTYINTQGANKTVYAYDYGIIPNQDEIKKLKSEAAERLKKAQEKQENQQREIEKRSAEIAKAQEAKRIVAQQRVLKVYQSRAETGDGFAQFRLGEIYFHGEGVETNFVLAQKWFTIAVTNGHPEATNFLNQLERNIGKR